MRRGATVFAPSMVHRPCNSLPFHGIRHCRLPRRAHPVRLSLDGAQTNGWPSVGFPGARGSPHGDGRGGVATFHLLPPPSSRIRSAGRRLARFNRPVSLASGLRTPPGKANGWPSVGPPPSRCVAGSPKPDEAGRCICRVGGDEREAEVYRLLTQRQIVLAAGHHVPQWKGFCGRGEILLRLARYGRGGRGLLPSRCGCR